MLTLTLPVLLALSPLPAATQPASNPQSQAPAQALTITCPLTGEEIPACCCPLRD
jgi:hypothetical protein